MAASPTELIDEDSPSEATGVTGVDDATIGDAASSRDSLGFKPYVDSLARFLGSDRTRGPLTVSLEGSWGAGKSSFMLQLERALQENATLHKRRHFVVRFNAWRLDEAEAIWASFALTFVRQMREQLPLPRRLWANIRVMWSRLDWEQGSLRLARTAALMLVTLLVASYGVATRLHPDWLTRLNAPLGAYGIPAFVVTFLGLLFTSIRDAHKTIGSPFEKDLTQYFDAPNYRGKRAFIEAFMVDFARLVRAYVGKDDRVFVFIDDIDRTEMTRAADVLQAIYLLTSFEDLPIIYVLGLDRSVVAAGIAAKQAQQLPYLRSLGNDADANAEAALDVAFEYLEKFINVPFRLPRASSNFVKSYIESFGVMPRSAANSRGPFQRLLFPRLGDVGATARADAELRPLFLRLVFPRVGESAAAGRPEAAEGAQADPSSVWIDAGTDSDDFKALVESLAPVLGTPRRIKQFLNIFRLQAYIAHETNLFEASDQIPIPLTLPQLAKITALFLRYPGMIEILRSKPSVMTDLQSLSMKQFGLRPPYSGDDADVRRLMKKTLLLDLLEIGSPDPEYSLHGIALERLFATLPHVLRTRNGAAKAPAGAEPSPSSSFTPSPTLVDYDPERSVAKPYGESAVQQQAMPNMGPPLKRK